MVHFKDDVDDSQLNLEERIFNIAAINDRVAYMNELEGLNRDFQTKVNTLPFVCLDNNELIIIVSNIGSKWWTVGFCLRRGIRPFNR